MHFFRLAPILSAVLLLAGPAAAVHVRVTGDRVNLRAVAKATAETVGQVSTGDELEVVSGLDGEWVEVVPPARLDLWIFAELVQGGQVVVSKAQVRAGAGLNFNVVGSLRRGAAVQERGRLGDWLKIAPPEGCSLWVNRQYVEPVAAPAAGVRPAGTVAVPAVQTILAPPPSAPAQAVRPEPPSPAPDQPAGAFLQATEPLPPAPAGVSDPGPPPPAPDPRYPEVPLEGAVRLPAAAAHPAPTGLELAHPVPSVPEPAARRPDVPPPPIPVPPPAPPTVPSAGASAGWERPAPPPVTTSGPSSPARARPRVLFPQQSAAAEVVGPAQIPADRLSPRMPQGRPGRFEGQLSKAGAIFYTPSQYRLVTLNRAGRAVTLCYVLGNERQLNTLLGARLIVEGPAYWFRSSQYPTLLAEQIQRLP